jgi:hypothetical protein
MGKKRGVSRDITLARDHVSDERVSMTPIYVIINC